MVGLYCRTPRDSLNHTDHLIRRPLEVARARLGQSLVCGSQSIIGTFEGLSIGKQLLNTRNDIRYAMNKFGQKRKLAWLSILIFYHIFSETK